MRSSRIISPDRENLKKLSWLRPADRQILYMFDTELDPEWEIYVRPHMNGVRPDFVLLHPAIGIAVFKVSEEENPSQKAIIAERDIVKTWKNDILKLYCPRLGACPKQGDHDSGMAVTAGVLFPHCNTSLNIKSKYYPISSNFDISHKNIDKILPCHRYKTSKFMIPEFAEDLRSWLTVPDFVSDSITPLNYRMLDSKQKDLVDRDKTKSGYRRIRGAAGSGKSLVLAIRAAKLAVEGKKVLIATYNITLWHYLRDLIIRALKTEYETSKTRADILSAPKSQETNRRVKSFSEYFQRKSPPYPQEENYEYEHFNNWGEIALLDPDKNPWNKIVFTHFHYWCKLICLRAGKIGQYHALWNGHNVKYVLDEKLPQRVSAIMEQSNFKPEYDAILLDEGQDYLPLWWSVLRKDLKPNGEVMLVADRTQDIYERGASWTEQVMVDAGFKGRWNELNISYRIPENLRRLAEIFVKNYIENADKILPEAKPQKQGELLVSNSILRWTQAVFGNSKAYCLKEIDYLLRQTGERTKLANADIIICVDSIDFGIELRNALRDKDIEVYDTFHDSHDADERAKYKESKAKKMTFALERKTLPSYQNPDRLKEGKAAVKITTIHSFKGYETPIMLLCLNKIDPALFYVAFTRVKDRKEGSIFSIVCADPNFKTFGEKFPKHGGEFFDKTASDIEQIHHITSDKFRINSRRLSAPHTNIDDYRQ